MAHSKEISTGAKKSPFDLRTFTYIPTKAEAKLKGGDKWLPEDIDHQHKVGICTAISTTMHAQKKFKRKFSPDFQYLLQKIYFDEKIYADKWTEGSSISSALYVGKKFGFLPIEEFKWITEQDRFLPYEDYIAKLKAIPQEEIDRLIKLCEPYKIKAYAKLDDNSRDNIAMAIDNSELGVQCMFLVGNEWWTDMNGNVTWKSKYLEPLRSPKKIVSGHAVNMTNYDANSYRIANSWGTDWCDEGTAYSKFNEYNPLEVWKVWYQDETLPPSIDVQAENRKKIIGQILDLLQNLIVLVRKLA